MALSPCSFGNICFVAGTPVNLSSPPRDLECESNLWSNDDWDSNSNDGDGTAITSVLRLSAIAAPIRILVPIEQVPLGARVPTKNPRPWEYDDSLPDPVREQWSRIELTYEGDDGRIMDVELLRPKNWLQSNEVFPNTTVFINMPELKVKGLAYVRAIETCPVIADGPGSVITARFATRSVSQIARAEIMGADGSTQVIEGTLLNHPFWSLDRNEWVPLGELEEGERLHGLAGTAVVLTHTIVNRSTPVYNVEVHGEHVYEVSLLGLLVHNACSFITTAYGTTIRIPHGWIIRVADNGKGLVAQAPGATGNANMIRIMDATARHPKGYVRYYNAFGQPVNPLTGKPGALSQSHIDLASFVGQWLGFPI